MNLSEYLLESKLSIYLNMDHVLVYSFFFFLSHLLSYRFYSLSLPVVSQIGGHIAG